MLYLLIYLLIASLLVNLLLIWLVKEMSKETNNLYIENLKLYRERKKRQYGPSLRNEGISYCQTLWNEEDCQKLDYIVMRESSWVVGIPNGEGCAGIGQACPASKMGSYAGTLEGETLWMMIYMQSYNRKGYQGIDGAYRHKIDFGWY